MAVCLPKLVAMLCWAAAGVAFAGCGDPESTLHALVQASSRPGFATPTAELTEATSAAISTETAEAAPSVETQPPASSTAELVTSTLEATDEQGAVPTKPPPCRIIEFSPGDSLTNADLVARGQGPPVRKPFLGVDLVIQKIGVDAQFVIRTVGPDGMMPRVGTATNVAWYDFSQWPGLGGTPGTDHGNVIVAGDYDDINVPRAVFYRLSELQRGDLIQINTSDGRTLAYGIEFNKVTAVDGIDWSELAASTPEESITLITAGAPLNKDRRIVWGRAFDTSCSH